MEAKTMKTVFSDIDQVAHLWANKVQDEAKTPSRNFYFTGDTIYSYGSHFPIAEHHKTDSNIVFFTTRGYSVTTSRHLQTVHRAANHKTLIYCEKPNGIIKYNEVFWLNINVFYKEAIMYLQDAEKPRIREKTRISLKEQAVNELSNIEKFLSAFDLTIDTLKNKSVWGNGSKQDANHFKRLVTAVKDKNRILTDNDNNLLADFKKAKDKAEKEKAKRQAIANAERLEKAKDDLTKWLKGDTNIYSHQLSILPQVYLRAIPKTDATEIQTSWGARVSLKEGKMLYKVFKTAPNKLLGKSIGGYTIVEVMRNFVREDNNKLDSSIKIGCHIIFFTEIERFAKKMKW